MHWRRKWQPTLVFLPGESQGWGSLVGCRLWGRTESNTTEATQQQQQHTQQIVKIVMIDFIIIASHTLGIIKSGIILGKHEYYFIASITQSGT